MNHSKSSPLVTAVVLSLNGQNYLRSQLAFYAHRPIHLILADGSDTDWGNGSHGKVGDMTWEYFRISGDGTYFVRLNEACRRIKTSYVLLLDDEDCTLWTGITKAIDFLELHRDYSAAGGRVFVATTCPKRIGLVSNSRYQPIDIAQDSPMERLNTLLAKRKSAHIVYQVLRTNVLVAYARSMANLSPTIPLGFAGRSFSWFLALSGKWKSTNNPYSIRRQSPRVSATREPQNQIFTSELATELSNRVFRALTDLSGTSYTIDHEETIETLSNMMLTHYSDLNTYSGAPQSLYFRLFGQSVALWIFNSLPNVYERLRANGIHSISRYAKLIDIGSVESQIYGELVDLEELWLQYPEGLAKFDLQKLL